MTQRLRTASIMLGILTTVLVIPSLGAAHTIEFNNPDAGNRVAYGSTGLAIRADGTMSTCFYDSADSALKVSEYDGRAWHTETVVSEANDRRRMGMLCTVIYDRDGVLHVVYLNARTSEVSHAMRQGAVWGSAVIDRDVRLSAFGDNGLSVALAENGTIGVAYYDDANRDLRLAQYVNGVWSVETVLAAGNTGHYPRLDFDANSNPAITCVEIIDEQTRQLQLVAHDGRGWLATEVIATLDRTGSYNDFQFDSQGIAHVTYRDYSRDFGSRLLYRQRRADRWTDAIAVTRGSAFESGGHCQLSIDAEDNAHIVYREYFRSALFPPYNRLGLVSLYFSDERGNPRAMQDQTVQFSPLANLDFASMSLAIGANGSMSMAYVASSRETSNLSVATITQWRPALALLTPTAEAREADDAFTMRWLDVDPDSDARIRFVVRDANWDTIELPGEFRENADNQGVMDTSGLVDGEYVVEGRISDDDFATYSGAGTQIRLTVRHAVVAAAPAEQPVAAPAQEPEPAQPAAPAQPQAQAEPVQPQQQAQPEAAQPVAQEQPQDNAQPAVPVNDQPQSEPVQQSPEGSTQNTGSTGTDGGATPKAPIGGGCSLMMSE